MNKLWRRRDLKLPTTDPMLKTILNASSFLFLFLIISISVAGNPAQEYFTNMDSKFYNRIGNRFGSSGASHLARTCQLILEHNRQAPPNDLSPLRFVNDVMNRVPQVADSVHWGVEDYWATPAEFIASNGGDCEDFVIAKYFALRTNGIPAEKLRLTYVKAVHGDKIENHMVLAYYPTADAEPLLLDNLLPQMLPASKRPDLLPVYQFNGELSGKFSGAAVRNWDALVERLNKEFD